MPSSGKHLRGGGEGRKSQSNKVCTDYKIKSKPQRFFSYITAVTFNSPATIPSGGFSVSSEEKRKKMLMFVEQYVK